MQINLVDQSTQDMNAQDIFDLIIKNRGLTDPKDRELFLSPPEPNLKSLIRDTKIKTSTLKSIQVILDSHIKSGHDICVFGDYDADGITATAILWQALIYYAKGKNVRILPFIPDRINHGYGLSPRAVDDITNGNSFKSTHFPDFKPSLIITVDNGIVAHPAAQLLSEKGIELVITDHHQVADTLPVSREILHSTVTSGAGIAWLLSLYLLKENEFSKALNDLATIGIVADMMPLRGTNRALVVHGLRALSLTKRAGLTSLYQVAKIEPSNISAYTIGFGIAPVINAAGRLYDPYDALRLLCATKSATAMTLATKIYSHNQDRQELTDIAITDLDPKTFTHKIAVLVGDYHEGIIGLIAGKIMELTHKPAIVISSRGDTLKASARSVTGVDITQLLRTLSVEFLSLGGHSQAAGFGLDAAFKDQFLTELYDLADSTIPDALLEPTLKVDLEITPSQVTLSLAKLLDSLSPYGIGNPKPKFILRDVRVQEDRKLGSTGKHRKLFVANGAKPLEVLLFNTKEPYPLTNLSVLVGNIDVNIWNSKESVQLIGNYVEH